MSFWHRPQRVLVRRVLFQVHVWTGLAVGLYAVLIGITGSVLTFRADLQAQMYPALFAPRPPGARVADPEAVIGSLERGFPGYRFSAIDYPHGRRGTFLAYLASGDELRTVFLDAASGKVIGELPPDGWIQRLQDLHFTLLAGPRGYVINGVGAGCLLVMCLTGLVIWWPGVSRVRPALAVHLDRGWRRVAWELHGAAAIWSSGLLIVWSLSGIYFSFPQPFRAAVEHVTAVTPYTSAESGAPTSRPPPGPATLVHRAQRREPGAQLARFGLPAGERGSYSVTLARVRHGDGDSSDEVTIYYDRYTGAELSVVTQDTRTAGDRILTWLGRLHVGNFGGVPVKIVWLAGGLVFPLLFTTGLVMWWNRFVRPRVPARDDALAR